MTTARQVVNSALELAGDDGVGQNPNNEQFTYALGVLNDMLHGWRAKGVDIGHETLSAGDTVNLLEEHIEPVKVLLATHPRIVARFGFEPGPSLAGEARAAWNMFYAAYGPMGPAPHDAALSTMPSRGRGLQR